ncbi:MAG: ATP-binding cassette domain-containing protein, partial [Candidatus Eremiobacteraeota bacterium]|nr:ATP-binding cassette domain-containing protein [Candidatus Eremiobacteraeota bacterium]
VKTPRPEDDVVPRTPRPEDDVVPRTPRPEDDVVARTPRPEDDVVPRRPRPEDDVVPKQGENPILDVQGIRKTYGSKVAVENLSFQLFPGDILGFLGPNGAGKTTTLRILATVLAADSGDATIGGHKLKEVEQVRARVGYMPDFLGVYDDLLVREYLEFFARAYKISPQLREFVIKEALETTRLTSLADNPVDGLSRGQKQRLGLARLLMHDPALLLLDEPAAGLDPRARVELRDILRGLQKKGKAMIVSSHILSDLADFCNKVAILAEGKLLTFKDTKRLIDDLRGTRKLRLKVLGRGDDARKYLEGLPETSEVVWEGDELVFEFQGHDADLVRVHKELFEQGYSVVTFSEDPWDLQDVYLRLTEGMAVD